MPTPQNGERRPRLFVVTVGIGEYADAKLNLKQAGNDAKALADLVQRRGTGLYERVDVVPLLGKDATLTGRTKIWDAIWRQIQERPWTGYGYSAVWDDKSG